MSLTKSFIRNAAMAPLDARLANMAQMTANSDGSPRTGVIGGANASIVSTTATMNVNIAAAEFATSKGKSDGVSIFTNDGTVVVAITAAPASNSRIDVIWVKHEDNTTGDAASLPIFGVTAGVAAASPTKPAIPTGALELATLRVYSGTTATNGGSNTLTNTYQMTAARGGIVPFRTKLELDAWTTATDGQLAYVTASKRLAQWVGGLWQAAGGVTPFADAAVTAGSIGGAAWVTLALTSPSASSEVDYSAGTPGRLTAQVKGRYRVIAQATVVASASVQARIAKNGTPLPQSTANPVVSGVGYPYIAVDVDLAVGDYVEFQVVSNSGGTLSAGLVQLSYVRAQP